MKRSTASAGAAAEAAVERFEADDEEGVRRLHAFLRTLGRDGEPDLAGLTLAVRQLHALAAEAPGR